MCNLIDGLVGVILGWVVGCFGLVIGWLVFMVVFKWGFRFGMEFMIVLNGFGYLGLIFISFCSVCLWRFLVILLFFDKLVLFDSNDIKIGISNLSMWIFEK